MRAYLIESEQGQEGQVSVSITQFINPNSSLLGRSVTSASGTTSPFSSTTSWQPTSQPAKVPFRKVLHWLQDAFPSSLSVPADFYHSRPRHEKTQGGQELSPLYPLAISSCCYNTSQQARQAFSASNPSASPKTSLPAG